jgi:mannose-6-phosphate isomerase-like protein (cupin superfamily)
LSSVSQTQDKDYILEKEKDIAKEEPGPHNGGGVFHAYSFFNDVPGYQLAFRKRALHPGAAIGYHLQKEDEVYYILSGTGE